MNYKISNLKIIIKEQVVDDIRKYYWLNIKYETGGILLGKFNRESKSIEISEIYELKINFFSKVLYKRCAKKAQKIIDKRWKETQGTINYIGEWHTHPNMLALPSKVDINSLKEINEKVKKILPCTILMIAGKDEKISLIVQNGNIIEMKILSKEEVEKNKKCMRIQ